MARARNIHGIGGTKPIPVTHFIPPRFSPVWKIDIVTDTETIDITELILNGEFSDGVTDKIGDFSFRLVDPSNNLTNRIGDFDTVNIYINYGKTATELRFAGIIERRSNAEQIWLDVSGRSIGMLTTGTYITYNSNGAKARSDILKEIINMKKVDGTTSKYFNGTIFDTGIEDDLTTITVNWEEIPFWQIVEELCISGGRDAYIGTDFVFNYFVKGSRENTTEAIVENINLIEAIDYAKDTEEISSRVRVYGNKIEGVPVLATSVPNTTYTKGIIKELKIDNSSVITTAQASELAEATSSNKLIPPSIGSIVSSMLPTILPGEKIKISNPINNIPPAYYEISSYKHVFKEDSSPETLLTIKKKKVELSTILKSNIQFKTDIPDNVNKYDMDFSQVIQFDTDSGIHNNTEINEEYLKVKLGQSSGTWISNAITLPSDVSAIEFRMSGNYLTKQYGATTSYIWFSLNGGTTWRVYNTDTTEVPSGRDLKIRIDLNSSDAAVKAVSVLYKQYS